MGRTTRIGLIISVVSVALAATAGPASAHTISPTSHNFGNVQLGQSSPIQHFTITAEGTPFELVNHSVSTPDFVLVTDASKPICGSFVTPGTSCVVSALFRPRSAGAKKDTMTVSYIGGTFLVPLSGNAVSTAKKKKKCKKKRGRSAAAAKKCKRR